MTTNYARIKKEIQDLKENKSENFTISVSDANMLEWHIKYFNLDDDRFKEGEYILNIKLQEGYPLKPPEFRWLTPNGRFEINTKICYNISTYHTEQWNPLWRLRTIIIGIMSMLFDTNTHGIGHVMNTNLEQFKKLANNSKEYNKNIIEKLKLDFS
jgi:hypothetical protein